MTRGFHRSWGKTTPQLGSVVFLWKKTTPEKRDENRADPKNGVPPISFGKLLVAGPGWLLDGWAWMILMACR
jgi:hypothetical protein